MSKNSLLTLLMKRDSLSFIEASDLIEEASDALYAFLDEGNQEEAYNICETYFNLEPDYLFELL